MADAGTTGKISAAMITSTITVLRMSPPLISAPTPTALTCPREGYYHRGMNSVVVHEAIRSAQRRSAKNGVGTALRCEFFPWTRCRLVLEGRRTTVSDLDFVPSVRQVVSTRHVTLAAAKQGLERVTAS